MPLLTPLPKYLINRPPTPRSYLGDYVLPEQSKLCLFGAPKTGKSLLAQQIAFSLVSNKAVVGFKTVQCKVAYLQSEMSHAMFYNRIFEMYTVFGGTIGNDLTVGTKLTFKLDRVSDFNMLAAEIEKLGTEVLVLDSWYKMLSSEENSSYTKCQDYMDTLIDKYKLSIIMLHHDTVPKIDPQTGKTIITFHPRGPRTLEGWFDSLIQLSGDVTSPEKLLTFELRHGAPLQSRKIVLNNGLFRPV